MQYRFFINLLGLLIVCLMAAGCVSAVVITTDTSFGLTETLPDNSESAATTSTVSSTENVTDVETTTDPESMAETTTLEPTTTAAATTTTHKATTRATTTAVSYKSPYYLKAYKGSFALVVYGKDSAGDFTKVVRVIKTAIGKNGQTPSGKFTLRTKLRWKTFSSSVYAQYAFQYTNYRSGNLYIHSPCYTSKNNTTMIREYYEAIGTAATSGCLRMSTGDTYWIYSNCPEGTTLEIFSSRLPSGISKPGDLPPIEVEGQDPTDPFLPTSPTSGTTTEATKATTTAEETTSTSTAEETTTTEEAS
jgi:lipoprotein-anchoring transpeptidase ErfK/SrfK